MIANKFAAVSSEATRIENDKAYVEKMAGTSPTEIQDAVAEKEAFEWVSVIHPVKTLLSMAA